MRRLWVFIGLIIFFVLTGIFFGLRIRNFSRQAEISSGVSTFSSPSPEIDSRCTLYTNEKYGFSLCYPINWNLPQEEKIVPPQQHLYQISLNPDDRSYMVNIYDQPSPISLESFVRDYFKEVESGVSWTKDVTINNLEGLQFFIPISGATPMGIGAVAFRKEGFILTISTPAKKLPNGNLEELVNESILTRLTESFQWFE